MIQSLDIGNCQLFFLHDSALFSIVFKMIWEKLANADEIKHYKLKILNY